MTASRARSQLADRAADPFPLAVEVEQQLGAVAFGVASAVAAYATTAEVLIAARAALGVAGATLAVLAAVLLRDVGGADVPGPVLDDVPGR
jgi:hypothetical protein